MVLKDRIVRRREYGNERNPAVIPSDNRLTEVPGKFPLVEAQNLEQQSRECCKACHKISFEIR